MIVREYRPQQLLGALNDVEAKNAPEKLYVSGDLDLLNGRPRLSIVGTRNASEHGRKRTHVLAKAAAARGIVIVSGLAEGIDTAAHEGVIAAGGHTIAVLGTPLDKPFPLKNQRLYQQIVQEHLAVSQFPKGYPLQRKNFPMRNRTMALLTDATVIVEAGEKSGTLHQGWEAIRLGRLLFLMESVAADEKLSWPDEMIRYGAQVLSRGNLDTVLDHLPSLSAASDVAL